MLLNLREARKIARALGAVIREDGPNNYRVKLGVAKAGTETFEAVVFYAQSPSEAAERVCLETARAALALMEMAKKLYIDSDLLSVAMARPTIPTVVEEVSPKALTEHRRPATPEELEELRQEDRASQVVDASNDEDDADEAEERRRDTALRRGGSVL